MFADNGVEFNTGTGMGVKFGPNVTLADTLLFTSCVGIPISAGGEIDPVSMPLSDKFPLGTPAVVPAAMGDNSLKLPAASNSALTVQGFAEAVALMGASVCAICCRKESIPALGSGAVTIPVV